MSKLELYNFCKPLREQGKTWTEIQPLAKREGIITRTVDAEALQAMYRDIAGEIAAYGMPEEASYDKDVRKFFNFIGKTRENIKANTEPVFIGNQTLVISDVHVPYHDMDKITRAVDHAKSIGVRRLLIAGDYLNGTQLSAHPKIIAEDFKKELTEGRMLLEMLAADFEEVILMDDNHVHSRWVRYIASNLTADLHFLTVHPYTYLTAGLDNVKRANEVNQLGELAESFSEEFGWFCKIGDAIFTHAEKHSANEFKMLRDIGEWFRKWEPILKLGPIRFVGQAHNHNVGMLHEADRVLAFTGCMVGLGGLTYSMSAKCAGSPPCHGYIILVQDENGKTDIEKTQIVRLTL